MAVNVLRSVLFFSYCYEKEKLDHKTRDIKWLIGKKLPPITRKQNTHLQNNIQAYMALWHRTVELRQQIQYSNHATMPIKNSPIHCQSALECNQSNPFTLIYKSRMLAMSSTIVSTNIASH